MQPARTFAGTQYVASSRGQDVVRLECLSLSCFIPPTSAITGSSSFRGKHQGALPPGRPVSWHPLPGATQRIIPGKECSDAISPLRMKTPITGPIALRPTAGYNDTRHLAILAFTEGGEAMIVLHRKS